MSKFIKESHNHITRDFRPRGKCPACDAYYDKHGEMGIGEIADLPRPLPPGASS